MSKQPLELYPYQQDCINEGKKRNVIVNLPTGRGKTLIAARLIDHFLAKDPSKKIAFLVPTRPLVVQQSEYCKEHCIVEGAPVIVQSLVGNDQDTWDPSDWELSMRNCHMFLGTAALFQQAFVTKKCLDISDFSLIVFDECHNAVGNSPMAAVMRDCVAPFYSSSQNGSDERTPRILGLTASFINGALKNIDKKRKQLEALLQSTIVCPDVSSMLSDSDKFRHVQWNRDENLDKHKEAIESHVQRAINSIKPVKDVQKLLKRCIHVFQELGLNALEFYIETSIAQQCTAKAAILRQQDDPAASRIAERIDLGLEALRDYLDELLISLKAYFKEQPAPSMSLKLHRLIKILRTNFETKGLGYRGIVFVEQVALVSPLAKQLNDAMILNGNVRSGAIAGTGHQSESDRQGLLDKFKNGEIQLLVATATLEEGIDVSQCECVVRFTHVSTTKAHIQGAGRARHRDAVCYYFENNPNDERRKEASMKAAARNQSISLTGQELQIAALSMSTAIEQRHPYPYYSTNTGEVNVFNCKQIFNQYCSGVLGTSLKPKSDLYHYSHAPGQQKQLDKIRYPTPEGWRTLSENDYRSYWNGVDMTKIFSSGRNKNKSASEKEEMAFVFIATVDLRKRGYLDSNNAPNASIKFNARRKCHLDGDWAAEAIRFKNVVVQSMHSSPTMAKGVQVLGSLPTVSVPSQVSDESHDGSSTMRTPSQFRDASCDKSE